MVFHGAKVKQVKWVVLSVNRGWDLGRLHNRNCGGVLDMNRRAWTQDACIRRFGWGRFRWRNRSRNMREDLFPCDLGTDVCFVYSEEARRAREIFFIELRYQWVLPLQGLTK